MTTEVDSISEIPLRPIAQQVIIENIPDELKKIPMWVCWKYEFRNSRWVTSPIDVMGISVDILNRNNWLSFEDALAIYQISGNVDGIGFILSEDLRLVGIKINDCIDDNGDKSELAIRDLAEAPSYAETSPDGRGILIIAHGTLPKDSAVDDVFGLEMYYDEQFIPLTGNKINDYSITHSDEGISAVYEDVFFEEVDYADDADDTDEWKSTEPEATAERSGLTLEDLTKWASPKKELNDEGMETGGKTPTRTMSPSKASTVIACIMDLALDEFDKNEKPDIWRYDGGIWKPDGARVINGTLYKVLGDLAYEKGARETLQHIRAITESVEFDTDPYLMPLENGAIDLNTGQFRALRQEDHATFKYAGSWNPEIADYHQILWFLCSSLSDPRDVLTVLDIITAIAIRVPFDLIVLLIGGGNNGKGILEKIILALYTMARASAIRLGELKNSRFGEGALLGKDVYIVSEVEGVKDAISVLKKVATGEMIDSDVKYKGRVQGMPHLKTIMDCNNGFDFGDNSYGRMRRMVKLDFPYTFGDAPDKRPIDRHLKEKLASPGALTGLVEIIAARAPALVESRHVYCRETPEEMAAELERQRDSARYFCDECLSTEWPIEGEDGPRLKTDQATDAYERYCKLYHVPTPGNLGKYISGRYDIQSKPTTEKGEQYRYYPGLYLVMEPDVVYNEVKADYRSSSCSCSVVEPVVKESLYSAYNITPTTATTDNILITVIDEIIRMYEFIQSCTIPRDITYENYRQKCCSCCSSVVVGQCIAVLPTTDQLQSDYDAAVGDQSIVVEELSELEPEEDSHDHSIVDIEKPLMFIVPMAEELENSA